jgi:glycosyltransferase involved in cell wall biosynthesis
MVNQLRITLASPYVSTNRGNSITAKRLQKGYEHLGHSVDLVAYEEASVEWIRSQLLQNQPLHVLHAYRYATFLEESSLPVSSKMIVTMTGTDHNHDIYHPDRQEKVKHILNAASYVVLFHEGGRKDLIEEVPELQHKIKVIPQGLILPASSKKLHSITEQLLDTKKTGDFIFLLPAGLRAVKNIFYSIPLLAQLRKEFPFIHLWIIGPVLEQDTYDELVRWMQRESWIHYGGEIPFDDMEKVYAQADVVLNTSTSEGQSSALLEAMAYGKSILAYDIPSNRYTVIDDQTGMLFKTETEFLQKAELLIQSADLREQLSRKSMEWVNKVHSPKQEILKYIELIESLE